MIRIFFLFKIEVVHEGKKLGVHRWEKQQFFSIRKNRGQKESGIVIRSDIWHFILVF